MNLLQLRTKIRAFLREPVEKFYPELDVWINDASFEATKDVDYPWKKKEQATTASQADYDVSADFVKIFKLLPAYYDGSKIEITSIEELDATDSGWRSASAGVSNKCYSDLPNKISLYPKPSLTKLSGSLTFTNGSKTVTGSGTSFLAQLVANNWIYLEADQVLVQVAAIVNNTELTLTSVYTGTGGSGVSYLSKIFLYYYIYKEVAMAADDSTNLIATNYPYLIIYQVLRDCEIKRGGSNNDIIKWENFYQAEVIKTRTEIFKSIRPSSGTSKIESRRTL